MDSVCKSINYNSCVRSSLHYMLVCLESFLGDDSKREIKCLASSKESTWF